MIEKKLPKRIFAKFYTTKKGTAYLHSAESVKQLLWNGEIAEVGEYRLVRSRYCRLVSGRPSPTRVRDVKK
jgi:hypothetical protein